MHRLSLTVNGSLVTATVEPRTHLADFLRDNCLLTGTHLGCEHGVCGACTILLDDAPARSCIAFAAACEASDIRTIEGLEDDPVTLSLREAFSAEHALQCGYCTPGMLVTARDIVLRVPDADEVRIRLELAGNLCRCTGYAGIVRAIRRVLATRQEVFAVSNATTAPATSSAPTHNPSVAAPASSRPGTVAPRAGPPAPLPRMLGRPRAGSGPSTSSSERPPTPDASPASGPSFTLTLKIARPLAEVWAALHDPMLLAACIPRATLTSISGDEFEGEIGVALGPISARFTGTGRFSLEEAIHRAALTGQGHDKRTHTHLSGTAMIALHPAGDATTNVMLDVCYALRGPLAQLARPAVIQTFAAEIAETVARNLDQRLSGHKPTIKPLSPARLLARILWRQIRKWLRRK